MLEKTWTITASDGAKIFGITSHAEKPNGKAVVMVHGLTGHPYEYQLKYVADGLCAKGYDVYRIALYWDADEKNRRLHECTLQTHASDLNDVIEQKYKDYEKLFLIGHSYGGPTIMIANPENITASSLWDPSFNIKGLGLFDELIYLDGEPLLNWSVQARVSKEMITEGKSYDEKACLELAGNCNFPVQVIHAGDGLYIKGKYSYHSKGDKRNRREVIEGTEHCFYEGDTCKELLEKTYNWFEEF